MKYHFDGEFDGERLVDDVSILKKISRTKALCYSPRLRANIILDVRSLSPRGDGMTYRFVDKDEDGDWKNNGLDYGIESNEDFPQYVEWFSSPEKRAKYAKKNGMRVV